MRKIPFAGIELTSQRVRGLRGTSELPERPATSGLGPSPFCFSFWSFLRLFSAEHILQRGISACRICLVRVDLLPLMLAKMCHIMPSSFFARAISARFLHFCAVSARCVLHLCSTALVAVACGLTQRSQLHCFMCLVFRCRLLYFCAREILATTEKVDDGLLDSGTGR